MIETAEQLRREIAYRVDAWIKRDEKDMSGL